MSLNNGAASLDRQTTADGVERLEREDMAAGPGETDALGTRWDRIALGSILLGLVVRAVWGLVLHPPVDFIYSDMGGYVGRAQELAVGEGLERYDAFWPPGTHLLLAVPFKVFGPDQAGLWAAAVLWTALSGLTPFFAWRLARILLGPAAAALAAAFCAFSPLFITYGGYFSSETPALAFLLGALWLGYRARAAFGRAALALGLLGGLLGGVAIANRPQFLLNVAILVLPALLHWRRQVLALTGIALGTGVVLASVLGYNSAAAGRLTGLSENSGMNFWMGHCDVRSVQMVIPSANSEFQFSLPVSNQLNRGEASYWEGIWPWDQAFFYDRALECIGEDGLGHMRLIARHVLDMTVTTVPWPQSAQGERDLAQLGNLMYCVLLPWIVIESLFLIRRCGAGMRSGEAVMLAHLMSAVVVAVLYFGDPRFRSSYDVFGWALLAALIVDRWDHRRSERVLVTDPDRKSPPH